MTLHIIKTSHKFRLELHFLDSNFSPKNVHSNKFLPSVIDKHDLNLN